ncbi:hypothetical protein BCR44DRAFT_1514601 [Catenaria anguillulae PL171]|uniref:Uncharacterized protein n=1 Tax=Catenaria anguillulae PL171 TaxID=765915 RepID=A0A1Y2HIG4_9FUNG|nr:hypothetical protein BCR44DRAFT_1514601 [Catenaria anguillulae PL171]
MCRGIRNQLHDTIIPPPTHTHAMANETAGNSTKDEDGGPARVNPWVQYYLDSTAAALWTRPTHVADTTSHVLPATPPTGPIPAHSPPSAAHQPAFYHHHHPPPPPPPQSHPTYQPPQYQHYPAHHHPPTMYYSTAPAPSPPLAPSPLFPPTTPPPHSASPTHFAPHQHSPTWPPPSPTSTDPTTSAPPAQLNPTNYLLSLASISLAVLQPFLFYQATGSPSASAALRRSTPAALVPKAITSVLITLFISCVMIPAFLTATAVAWARSGKQQALRDMREVVLVVHSRWMGDDLKHITRPLAQGLTLLGNVIEHAPSVRLTPGMIRAAIQGVGPSTGLRDQVVQRVMRVAATGAPNVAVLVHI